MELYKLTSSPKWQSYIEDRVRNEILCCVSSVLDHLWKTECSEEGQKRDLYDQMLESFYVRDYISAAYDDCGKWLSQTDAENYCEEKSIEPYDLEIFEYWAVSNWLADKLIEQGEPVAKDLLGLNVWGRTTTGQQISADEVINKIYFDLAVEYTPNFNPEEFLKNA